MITAFHFQGLPTRVVFEIGGFRRLAEEAKHLGRAALVICTPNQRPLAEAACDGLGGQAVGIFDRAQMHVPTETVHAALEAALRLKADSCVTVGGGSTIGLGKAIALEIDLPILAVPTTYAGSEMTPIWGLTEKGLKKTGRDLRVLPRTVLYDPELTLSLPARLSAYSGMNAIAHAVEALYAADANPIVSMYATECIRALMDNLPRIVADPLNIEARAAALYGSWLGGLSLGSVGMALHHKICHTLGGTFDLPHAETHTIVLPHVVRFNEEAAPILRKPIGSSSGSTLADQLDQLPRRLGLKSALKDIGMLESDLAKAASLILTNIYCNPRVVTPAAINAILAAAFHGDTLPPRYHS